MRLNTLSLFALLVCLGKAYAQTPITSFYKNNGVKVTTRDSADFIRETYPTQGNSKLFDVREYYPNDKLRFTGKSSRVDFLMREGECTTYYPSGTVRAVVNYTFNIPDGDGHYFYPNGKLYTYRKFIVERPAPNSYKMQELLIMANNDSTGKALVIEGNGHYTGYKVLNEGAEPVNAGNTVISDFSKIAEEGDVKNGLKNGKWTSAHVNGDETFALTEYYDNGKFINGESKDDKGKVVKYTSQGHEPMFPGGAAGFNMFLGQHVKYPEDARRNNIQGRVYVSFNIEKDGSLTGAKIERSPNPMLSQAALAAVIQSPKWEPGMQNGRAVKVRYTVPVNFSLGNPGN